MPWKTTEVSEQRMQFVIRAVSGGERLSALCREFGVSRPTGYLWRRRYQQAGSLTALEGQRVRIERFEHKLLVSYRHMYIREVDLRTGERRSLVVARATSEGARRATKGAPSDAPNPGSHELQV